MDLHTLPPVAAMAGLVRMLTGRVHFDRDRIGDVLTMENGEGTGSFVKCGLILQEM